MVSKGCCSGLSIFKRSSMRAHSPSHCPSVSKAPVIRMAFSFRSLMQVLQSRNVFLKDLKPCHWNEIIRVASTPSPVSLITYHVANSNLNLVGWPFDMSCKTTTHYKAMRSSFSLGKRPIGKHMQPIVSLIPQCLNIFHPLFQQSWIQTTFWPLCPIATALNIFLACFTLSSEILCFDINNVNMLHQNVLCSCKSWLLCRMKRLVTSQQEPQCHLPCASFWGICERQSESWTREEACHHPH